MFFSPHLRRLFQCSFVPDGCEEIVGRMEDTSIPFSIGPFLSGFCNKMCTWPDCKRTRNRKTWQWLISRVIVVLLESADQTGAARCISSSEALPTALREYQWYDVVNLLGPGKGHLSCKVAGPLTTNQRDSSGRTNTWSEIFCLRNTDSCKCVLSLWGWMCCHV